MEKAPSHRLLLGSYAALMVLLALTALASSLEPRWLSTSLSLGIAVAKAAIILFVFMRLAYRSARTRVVALAGYLWLAFLFAFTFSDYLTRGLLGIIGK